jgi:hypothetical protein
VLETARAIVTAGFANEVEAVNQYAAAMYVPTANGTLFALNLEQPQITDSKPKVAMNSLKTWDAPLLTWSDKENSGSLNIR